MIKESDSMELLDEYNFPELLESNGIDIVKELL